MNFSVVAVALVAAFLIYLGYSIVGILNSGRAPSLIRVGHTPIGPDLEKSESPLLYWFSVTVMSLVWLVCLAALLKFLN